MKTVHIILGVLVLLLFMVGSAGATTFYLTNTSEDVNGIRINVTFDGTRIFVTDESPALVGVQNVDIKGVKLYLGDEYVDSVADPRAPRNIWTHKPDYKQNFAGFGEFYTDCSKSTDKTKSRGPVIITLKPSYTQSHLTTNALGNSIVVHLGFGTELIDVGGKKQDSSWVTGDTQIPEFSSIAVPVMAILGLLFISGRRRKE